MSDNRISGKERQRRRKRQLMVNFLITSFCTVSVFLFVLLYFVTGGFGQKRDVQNPVEKEPQTTLTEISTETDGAESESEMVSVYIDVTPPKGVAYDQIVWWKKEMPSPEEFVKEMKDDTEITVTYQTEPDMTLWEKEQTVRILLTDEGNNQTMLVSSMLLRLDEEAPKMQGIYNLTIFEGESIQYRKYLKVTDNLDENPKITIDSSQVNRNKAGTYYVTYRAEDKAGNVAEEEIFVTVMEKVPVTQEMVDEMADQVLAEIITEGMSDWDKAYAIYRWTKRNIAYTGHTDPSDMVAGAYQGLKYRAGDCFTFCSVAHMLYQRAGFQTMKVSRTAGYLNHYWNYVNLGDGWYHCDSNLYCADGFEAFMKTTEELIAYTTNVMNRPDYYVYDESLYPPCGAEKEEQTQEETSEESPVSGQEG